MEQREPVEFQCSMRVQFLATKYEKILHSDGNLSTLLNDEKNRDVVASETISKGFAQESDRTLLLKILERLCIVTQHMSYTVPVMYSMQLMPIGGK